MHTVPLRSAFPHVVSCYRHLNRSVFSVKLKLSQDFLGRASWPHTQTSGLINVQFFSCRFTTWHQSHYRVTSGLLAGPRPETDEHEYLSLA